MLLPAWPLGAARRNADLVVDSVDWSIDGGATWGNEPVVAGDEVWFQAIIRNDGQAAVPPGKGIDARFRVGSNLVSWTDPQKGGLAIGESRAIRATTGASGDEYWVPTQDGTATVEARIDAGDALTEVSEGNNTASATIIVEPAPVAPVAPVVANDDLASTEVDTVIVIDVLANDTGPSPMVVTSVQSPTDMGGTAVITADNRIEYTPPPGFKGDDRFSYQVDLA